MGTSLFTNYEEVVAMLLFGIGFTTLLFNRNLLKKIIGFNFMDTGIYLFLTSMGYIEGGLAPIYVEGLSTAENYINPIPAGLVLTADCTPVPPLPHPQPGRDLHVRPERSRRNHPTG